MNKLGEMVDFITLPKVVKIEQIFDSTVLENSEIKLNSLLSEKLPPLKEGSRIAITGGSRGVAEYALIMKTIVSYLKMIKCMPFIVPAMGSHGGATPEGQTEVLEHLGITEELVGAPIVSSMDVVEIARTSDNLPVYIDKNASQADGIILLNRVKSHTSIRGDYQSGLLKMISIGLAKHTGAIITHSQGTLSLRKNMVEIGKAALKSLKIVAGISIIENGYEQLADIYVSRKNEILETEPKILRRAIGMIPTIKIPEIDCLVVVEQGKDISGTGMDPAIIGRPINRGPNEGPNVESLGVLRITKKSFGNASGCGMADFISREFHSAINEESTCINSLTGMHPEIARIPMTFETDKEVFQACCKASGKSNDEDIKMVIIKNTKSLEEIYISKAAFDSIKDRTDIKQISDYFEIPFDNLDRLVLFSR